MNIESLVSSIILFEHFPTFYVVACNFLISFFLARNLNYKRICPSFYAFHVVLDYKSGELLMNLAAAIALPVPAKRTLYNEMSKRNACGM